MCDYTSILALPDGATIAYRQISGKSPGIIFCNGFKSDMTGRKARALETWCSNVEHQFTRFDYQGHGESSGQFEEGTIGLWKTDALAVLDNLSIGKQILVGSSMGGWIAFLLAISRPKVVTALVGIAAAVDFTESLLWPRLREQERTQIMEDGIYYRPSVYDDGPYPITRTLIEDAKKHLILSGPIAFNGPVRLLHGMLDDAVPWEHTLKIADAITTKDVEIILIKDGEHRLSRESDLERLISVMQDLLSIK